MHRSVRDTVRTIVPVLGLIIVFVLFSLTTGGKFLTLNNMKNMLMQSSITMVAAVGTTFVMAHNNLDFSLGGVCALCCVVAYLIAGTNIALFFLICIAMGILCGLFSSFLHIWGQIPAFMAGLCLMFAGRGIAQSTASRRSMVLTNAARFNTFWFFMIVLVAVVVAGFIVFNFTKIGKAQKLIGTNPKATQLSGINVNRYKVIAFAISGATVGIASCLTVARGASVVGNTGLNLETNVLLALSIGGIAVTGGSATRMRSAIIGTLIFYMLNNGLTLWGLNADYVDIVKAVFFLVTVSISIDRSQYDTIA